MRAKFIYEKFSESGDPVKDMGIGDFTTIMEQKLQKKADKHGFDTYKKPRFADEEDIEGYGYENVKIIRCWYKETNDDDIFRELIFYTYNKYNDKKKRYGIYEVLENAVSGGDEINNHFFTDEYWK